MARRVRLAYPPFACSVLTVEAVRFYCLAAILVARRFNLRLGAGSACTLTLFAEPSHRRKPLLNRVMVLPYPSPARPHQGGLGCQSGYLPRMSRAHRVACESPRFAF